MSFMGGPELLFNDYMINFIPQMLDRAEGLYGDKTGMERYANWWRKGLMKDPGRLLDSDPLKGQYAQQADQAERQTRANLAFEGGSQPVLVNRNVQLARDRSNQNANISREAFIHGNTNQILGAGTQANLARKAGLMGAYQGALQGYGQAGQVVNKPGWGALALDAAFGAAGAASGFKG